jgi:predicted transcriptional regulator
MTQAAPAFQKKFQHEIDRLTAAFAADLVEVVKAAILESVAQAVGGALSEGAANGASAGKAARRPPEELQRAAARLLAAIAAQPGLRIEQLAKALGAETKELSLPVKRLLEAGQVKSKGTRRATTYWPAKNARRS